MISFFLILFLAVFQFPSALMAQNLSQAPPSPSTETSTSAPLSTGISSEERFHLNKARSSFDQADYESALSSYEQFLLKFPNSPLLPDVYLQLASIYATKGESRRAIETIKTVLEQFPEYHRANEARLQLSNLYLSLGELKEVISFWNEIPGEEASKIFIYDRVAEIYSDRREYYNALQVLIQKKELLVDPVENEAARNAVISIIKEKLQEQELQSVVKKFGSQFPSDEAIIRLIHFYDVRGDYFREEKEIRRFLSLFPNHGFSPNARNLIGETRNKIKAERYLIAVVLPLSGKAAPYGNTALNGVELALQQFKEALPGASVGLVVKDIADDFSRLPGVFEAWLDEYRPIAMIGPLLSKEVDQIAPIVEKAKMILITPAATASRLVSLGKSVFRNAMTNRWQCHAIAEYAVLELNLKFFAILFPKESFGVEWVKCFSEEVTKLGGEIVHAEPYPLNETDFSHTIRLLKEADLKKNGVSEVVQQGRKMREISYTPGFEAIFLPGEAPKMGLIIPQLVFHNIKGVTLLGSNGWNSPEFLRLVGPHAEGATFVDGFFQGSPDPVVRKFVTQYQAKFQQEPDLFAAQAFDATRLVLAALEEGALTAEDVKAAVSNTKGFPGVSGFIFEIQGGEIIKKPYFIQVQKGKFVQIN